MLLNGIQQKNLDKQFKENVLTAIEKLQSDKIIHGPVYNDLSRVFVKRFPYSIYFRKDLVRKQIIVAGILHFKQNRSLLDRRF